MNSHKIRIGVAARLGCAVTDQEIDETFPLVAVNTQVEIRP